MQVDLRHVDRAVRGYPHPIGRPPPAAPVSKATHTNSIVDAKDTTANLFRIATCTIV